MTSRVIWILLFIGILCVSMSVAQSKKQNPDTGPGKAQPPVAQAPVPATDSVTELQAKVETLEQEVSALKASLNQSTLTNSIQVLNSSLQVATWVTLIIVVLILASAVWLWLASKG